MQTNRSCITKASAGLSALAMLGVVILLAIPGKYSWADHEGDDRLPQRLATAHLPNAVQVHRRVISGGLPEGDAGFQELVGLGVKTIISVDGMKPDLAAAERYSLRYVHLPHGYDGVPAQRIQQLAAAVSTLDGPIYIHCHHGRHRSPAAAASACVAAGLIRPEQSKTVLTVAGTSPHYRGLFQSVQRAKPLSPQELVANKDDFPAVVPLPPIAETMVTMEHIHDHLESMAANQWQALPNHPDWDPEHVALMLEEQFAELLRMPDVKSEAAQFRRLLSDSQRATEKLRESLTQWKSQSNVGPVPQEIHKHANVIAENCRSCHRRFRDVPRDVP